jgi:hypothetical protein
MNAAKERVSNVTALPEVVVVVGRANMVVDATAVFETLTQLTRACVVVAIIV